jgi:hypothetical protein
MNELEEPITITAEQVANYVVCPEAWRLKYLSNETGTQQPKRPAAGRKLRREWVEEQDLSTTLRSYAKIVYLLTVLVVIIVFLIDIKRSSSPKRRVLEPAQITSPP